MTSWDELPDDLESLARMSLDLRLSWDEPDNPTRLAAWRKWYELKRRERELPRCAAANRAAAPPPPLFGSETYVARPPRLSLAEEQQLRRRLTGGTRLVVTL